MSPGSLPGWDELTTLESIVWGYLLMPGKRNLKALADARAGRAATQNERTSSYSSMKNAKANGYRRMKRQADPRGVDLDSLISALRDQASAKN